jgi:hypothetical protein
LELRRENSWWAILGWVLHLLDWRLFVQKVKVNVVTFAEGSSVGTEEGELVVGNMGMGAALVGLASEIGVSVVTLSKEESVATEEGELMLGNMGVGAALVGLAVVGREVGVNVVTFAEGSSVGTEEGDNMVGNMG